MGVDALVDGSGMVEAPKIVPGGVEDAAVVVDAVADAGVAVDADAAAVVVAVDAGVAEVEVDLAGKLVEEPGIVAVVAGSIMGLTWNGEDEVAQIYDQGPTGTPSKYGVLPR